MISVSKTDLGRCNKYIDDVIIHTASHKHHLEVHDNVLQGLEHHNLKINLAKCYFGNSEVAYLGFVLTPEGIRQGKEKLAILRDIPPPTSQREVWAFIGLCNFFCNHIKNFALIAQPLHRLTRKDMYKKGPLDPAALKAFHTIKNALILEPVVAFPRSDCRLALISEVHPPSEQTKGAMSATLSQINDKGSFHVLSHASRQLQAHEANYLTFCWKWPMLCTKWKPMMNTCLASLLHFSWMNDLNLNFPTSTRKPCPGASLEYNFIIQNETGSGMPLSLRTASWAQVHALTLTNPRVQLLQSEDPDLQILHEFRTSYTWPENLQPDSGLKL